MRLETAASMIPQSLDRWLRLGTEENPTDKKVDPWTTPPPK